MTRKEIERLSTEGSKGLQDLAKMANALGYGESVCAQLQLDNGCFVSDITNMLEDNPGMIEALYEFILDHESSYEIEEEPKDEEGEPT